MIKRPLDKRFGRSVLEMIKISTIRKTAWPMGVPIMLYHWSGKPYHSKHVDVAAVQVDEVRTIRIRHGENGTLVFGTQLALSHPLWYLEGFSSEEEMDDWFRPLVKKGETLTQYQNIFHLLSSKEQIDAVENLARKNRS